LYLPSSPARSRGELDRVDLAADVDAVCETLKRLRSSRRSHDRGGETELRPVLSSRPCSASCLPRGRFSIHGSDSPSSSAVITLHLSALALLPAPAGGGVRASVLPRLAVVTISFTLVHAVFAFCVLTAAAELPVVDGSACSVDCITGVVGSDFEPPPPGTV